MLILHKDTAKWEPVEAILLYTCVKRVLCRFSKIGLPIQGGYKTCVEYQYTIDSINYTGKLYSYDGNGVYPERYLAEKGLSILESDDTITVYVDRDDPSRAVIKRYSGR